MTADDNNDTPQTAANPNAGGAEGPSAVQDESSVGQQGDPDLVECGGQVRAAGDPTTHPTTEAVLPALERPIPPLQRV